MLEHPFIGETMKSTADSIGQEIFKEFEAEFRPTSIGYSLQHSGSLRESVEQFFIRMARNLFDGPTDEPAVEAAAEESLDLPAPEVI